MAPGDYVDDTNAEANPQTACTPTHSCSPSLFDPITNFMDYRCSAQGSAGSREVSCCIDCVCRLAGYCDGAALTGCSSDARSVDPCMTGFTFGQAARMVASFAQYRDPTLKLPPPSPPAAKPRSPPPPVRAPPPVKAVTKPVTARPPPPKHAAIVTSAKEVRRVPWPYSTAYLKWYGR